MTSHWSSLCGGQEQVQGRHSVISSYAAILVLTLTGITATIINSFLLYIMATNSHFRTPSGILVSFMAFTDLLTGCVSIPTYVANQVAVVRSITPSCPLYILYKTSTVILLTITILLLAALSFDRYLLAGKGTKKPNWKLKRIYKVIFLTIWIITLAAVIPAFLDSSYRKAAQALGLLIGIFATACITFSHINVFLSLRARRRILPGRSIHPLTDFRIKWLRKSVNTLIIIIVMFVLCFTPRSIYIILSLVSGETAADKALEVWSVVSLLMNSAITPAIYIHRSRNIRLIIRRHGRVVAH
eukprot:gene10319-19017_t